MTAFEKTRRILQVGSREYLFYSIKALQETYGETISRLPVSLKVLLENMLRFYKTGIVKDNDIIALASWKGRLDQEREMAFKPARVLMQDFTGVPAVVDLAAMRDALAHQGKDPSSINPLTPVDLVIDHSVMVDYFGATDALAKNVALEYQRNGERYAFLRWGQNAFRNFRVVPPGTGICHQVNLEYLAKTVWIEETPEGVYAYPDTVVGTDSHTTMVNSLSVLGWGVGGIEAEAVMLGQPISMVIPEVIGFKLTGKLREGATATDLVLTITQMLRTKGVVGKFVEFYGPGLQELSLADRATIANMAPEYGATCGFFPIDQETIAYLKLTGRDAETLALVEAYAREQGLWWDVTQPEPVFSDTISLDMALVVPCLAGPKRPQDRVTLPNIATEYKALIAAEERMPDKTVSIPGMNHGLTHGDIVIAAITSCTNTSNPAVLIGAGLLAQNALKKGLSTKPWVKTSLAPGSQVVSDYLEATGLQAALDQLGFNIIGYGCTTCIGNSGPLPPAITHSVTEGDLNVCAVLSGNRNFEGRINAHVKSNYLASPMLVVAYALAGNITINLETDPLGVNAEGNPVFLKDIWPSNTQIRQLIEQFLTPDMFRSRYGQVFEGDTAWKAIQTPLSQTYAWQDQSTYVKSPPYFKDTMQLFTGNILGARALAILGDSITTDHISPAGSIKQEGPAGQYLMSKGVDPQDFNSYGARRGNHEVMIRGTFANIRLKNEMLENVTGGYTKLMPDNAQKSIFEAAEIYGQRKTPLIVIAGKEYGTGSSRDWAAKGTRLLGVRAVIAESFERIHRSNLVGMGVLPLIFPAGVTRKTLELTGAELFDLTGLETLHPKMIVTLGITYVDNHRHEIPLTCRIDTTDELAYFKAGGILPFVAGKIAAT